MSQVIGHASHVRLHFSLSLADGQVIESTQKRDVPAQLQMGDGNLPAPFEQCLLGLCQGDERRFTLSAEQAFGLKNPQHVRQLTRSQFAEQSDLQVGTVMAFRQPNGQELPGVICAITEHRVTVDFNHPLAGHEMIFAVEILAVDNEDFA